MGLSPSSDLAIAQVAFFSPALCISLFVFFRHGFSKSAGWFYLVTLCILRLIGASCLLYINTKHDYSQSLLETAAITSAIGTAPLLLALVGFMGRVNRGLQKQGRAVPPTIFQILQLIPLVALIVAIVGGVNEPQTPALYKQGNNGTDCTQAASVLFMFIWACLAVLTVDIFLRRNAAIPAERKLIYAGIAAIPLLFVRVLYTVFVAFYINDDFFYRSVNVYVESFMQFLMEALVVTLYITAGLLTPREEKPLPQDDAGMQQMPVEGMGMGNDGGNGFGRTGGAPWKQRQQQPMGAPQHQRNIGDYRPSRLIMNAINNRNRN